MKPKRRKRVNYKQYINSPAWRKKRETYKRYRTWRCLCGETEGLHLHHKTYERLGHEDLDDLQPLCAPCHKLVHQMVDAGEIKIDLKGFFAPTRSKPTDKKKTIQEVRQDHARSLLASKAKKPKPAPRHRAKSGYDTNGAHNQDRFKPRNPNAKRKPKPKF